MVFLLDVGEEGGVAVVPFAAGAEKLSILLGLEGGRHPNITL
jgi:hypothetical protein